MRPARPAESVLGPEAPRLLRLPSGTAVPVRAVSTRDDGELAVPEAVGRAGWWRGGSRVGDPFGSTLVAAHIDSLREGLGPFGELLGVRPGQRVVVRTATLRQVFRIRSLRLVPQGSLAERDWIFSARGDRRLTLVTCAPPYDRGRGGYQRAVAVGGRRPDRPAGAEGGLMAPRRAPHPPATKAAAPGTVPRPRRSEEQVRHQGRAPAAAGAAAAGLPAVSSRC